jgi:rfaE bifunctional protein nucleotidyltransferase chain/domain
MTAISAITVSHVTKVYRRYSRGKKFATLKSALINGTLIGDLKADETFPALNGVSFTVPKGVTFGILGRNGSGKSTLLKLVAGITKPTTGTVDVRGRVSALIELGAGFHPEISGRENVFINGIMLGLSKKEITRRFDEIVEFAELRDFIDAPVKTYSSGMYMRLGFAVAIHVDPEVLLIDEVLAVGDEAFTHKCLDKFGEFRRRGKTILLVTHSLSLIERFCDEALWLDAGRSRERGEPMRVVGAYRTSVEDTEERTLAAVDARARTASAIDEPEPAPGPAAGDPSGAEPPEEAVRVREGRWGSREVEIRDVVLQDHTGQPGHVFQSGESISVHLTVRAAQPVDDFVFGIGLFNPEGVCCYGTNTYLEELEPESIAGDAEVVFAIDALDLVEGTYKMDVAVHKIDGYPYDYHRLLYTFRVKSRTPDVGIYRPRHSWTFSGNVSLKPRQAGGEASEEASGERREAGADGPEPSAPSPQPMLDCPGAAAWAEDRRRQGRRVVFTNGVFDLLHPGHIRFLEQARAEGDALIVAVNSDRSVRAAKGPSRPIVPEAERAEVLAALACVDAVAIFDEDDPYTIVSAVQPDVLVKGADWAADRIIGRDVVEARSGRVVRIALADGYSTSALLDRMTGV